MTVHRHIPTLGRKSVADDGERTNSHGVGQVEPEWESRSAMLSVADIALVLSLPHSDGAIRLYDRLAPRYERLHRIWLRVGGVQALAALQGGLAAELRPGVRVLDAGCGPGSLGRWIALQEPDARLTLLDAAPAMLERAASVVSCRHVHGDLLALPFADASFDVVACTWALETLTDPQRAYAELERVLAPGGLLCCCFCTEPAEPWVRFRSLPMRVAITRLFKGRFLRPDFPDGQGRRIKCHNGLSVFVCRRKSGSGVLGLETP